MTTMNDHVQELTEWFRVVNASGDGRITFKEWDTALCHANPDKVLRSRGVVMAHPQELTAPERISGAKASTPLRVGSAASLPTILTLRSAIQKVTDTIAALLQYSGLSVEEGFDEFDKDGDGFISRIDLTTSCESLELDASSAGNHSQNTSAL